MEQSQSGRIDDEKVLFSDWREILAIDQKTAEEKIRVGNIYKRLGERWIMDLHISAHMARGSKSGFIDSKICVTTR